MLRRLWTKFHEIWGQSRRPFVLFCAFVRLSMSGFVQKIFAIKSRIIKSSKNRTNVKVFDPQFFSGGTTPTFLRQIVSAIYCAPFGKSLTEFCLLMSVCKAWQWSGMRNLRRVGKIQVQFEAVCEPKFMTFWDDVGDPRSCEPAYRLSISCFTPKTWAVKAAVKLQKTQNCRRVGENAGPILAVSRPKVISFRDDVGHSS